ncbi:MAG: CHAT domain-containing protein, partial [Bacteriovoracaceae bacterium]
TYEKAIELTDKIRRGFGTEGAKIQLSQMSFDVYERAISSALFLFQKTKNTSYISKAFSIAERSKAGMLLDAIFESNAKQFAGIPDSLLEQESAFRTELTYHETLLQKEKEKKDKANEVKIVQWENRIFDLKRDNEQLVERFEREYPKYYSLKHQSEVISLSDIQKQLPDTKSALLEYVVGDTTVTIFAITKKSCIVKSQRLTSLTPLVKQFRQSIQNIEAREYIFLANGLYRQLIAPVQSELKGVQKLYIVPDGILNHLPFEALLTHQWENSVAVDFSALPYLIRFYDVSYHISARSFLEHVTATQQKTSAKKDKKPEHEFMGIAPVFADTPAHSGEIYTISTERIIRSRTVDGERFVELKESEREVKSIFKLFEEHQKSGKMYLHNSATESSFKSDNMQETRFIHIATHGMINEENPKLSGVIFAAPEKGAMDDGVLYSGETYNLRLNADLVTLSACETGLGTIVKGEGLLGLTRGFMYAGAKNLLVSLWQVADKSTTELMVQFYRNILNNQQYSTALRNAKLAMIKKGKYAHPVEWSPFILTGK